MPRNGSGEYNLPANSWGPLVSGDIASSSDGNQTLNDLASALTTSIATDGQSVVTGNISFNGFQLLAVGGVRVSARASAGAPYALYPAGLGGNDGIYFGSSGTTVTAFNGSIITTTWADGFRVLRGQFIGRNGSAGNPAFTFVGATDSGLWCSGAFVPTVYLSANGVSVFGIDENRPYIYQITNDSGATPIGLSADGVYRITSSQRWKAEIADLDGSLNLLDAIRPRTYKRKLENGQTVEGRTFSGFIAEEVHDIKPGLVNVGKDGIPESLDTNGLVAELWAAVQVLKARVLELEAANGA